MSSGPFRGLRAGEAGQTTTPAQLQRSRRKFGGGGPTSRDSPGLEAQKPGLGVRGPGFGHSGSPRTHRLGQQEAAFERAEEGARRQQGAEPRHCPVTSGAVRGLRIGLRLCVRGPHSGATSSSLGLTASPSALEGSGNPLCGRRKSGVRLGPGTHPRLPRLQHLQSSPPSPPTAAPGTLPRPPSRPPFSNHPHNVPGMLSCPSLLPHPPFPISASPIALLTLLGPYPAPNLPPHYPLDLA